MYLPYLLHQYPALSPPIIPPNAKIETVVAQRIEMLVVVRYSEELFPCPPEEVFPCLLW